MKDEFRRLVRNYGLDVLDELDVSPFEYVDTFRMRDFLSEKYIKLDSLKKELLNLYDNILLNRDEEFFNYLKTLNVFTNSDNPVKYWWWHLEKVVSGELIVDVDKNEVIYNNKKYPINSI